MSKIQYQPVYAGTFFLLLIAVLSVVNNEALPAELLFNAVFYPLLFGLGLAFGSLFRKNESAALKTVGVVIIIAAFPVFFTNYYFHGPEKAAVVLLIWLQAGRNFTLATRRDLFYAYIVSLILILYGASVSKETGFLIYLLAYVLAGIFTLMSDHIDERLAAARGGDRDFLVKGLRLPSKGIGLAAMTIALSFLIYLLFPRLPSPHLQGLPFGGGGFYENEQWDNEAERLKNSDREKKDPSERGGKEEVYQSEPGAGKNPQVSRRAISDEVTEYAGFRKSFDVSECKKTLSRSLLFYLQSDRPLYVRGKVFENFDGRVWHETDEEGELIRAGQSGFILNKDYHGGGTGQVYTIKKKLPPLILSAYRPVMVRFPSNLIRKTQAFSLYAPEYLKEGTKYSVLSEIGEIEGRATGGTESYEGGYLQLPSRLSDRVKGLAASLVEGQEDDYHKAAHIEAFLRTNYTYTLDTVLKERSEDVADDFLFQLGAGHCEYFASAMVVMLRSVGIPSRLVTGYTAFTKNPFTGYYEVRALNAHAWVEAYFDHYGWVTFEPTPNMAMPQKKHEYFAVTTYARYLQEQIDTALHKTKDTWWSSLLNGLNQALLRLRRFFSGVILITLMILHWFIASGWKLIAVLISVLIPAFLLHRLFSPLWRRIKLLRKKNDPRRFVISCYQEVGRFFSEKDTPRRADVTHSEYREILEGKFGLLPEIESITSLFEKACYSPCEIVREDSEEAYRCYRTLLNSRPACK